MQNATYGRKGHKKAVLSHQNGSFCGLCKGKSASELLLKPLYVLTFGAFLYSHRILKAVSLVDEGIECRQIAVQLVLLLLFAVNFLVQ